MKKINLEVPDQFHVAAEAMQMVPKPVCRHMRMVSPIPIGSMPCPFLAFTTLAVHDASDNT